MIFFEVAADPLAIEVRAALAQVHDGLLALDLVFTEAVALNGKDDEREHDDGRPEATRGDQNRTPATTDGPQIGAAGTLSRSSPARSVPAE